MNPFLFACLPWSPPSLAQPALGPLFELSQCARILSRRTATRMPVADFCAGTIIFVQAPDWSSYRKSQIDPDR